MHAEVKGTGHFVTGRHVAGDDRIRDGAGAKRADGLGVLLDGDLLVAGDTVDHVNAGRHGQARQNQFGEVAAWYAQRHVHRRFRLRRIQDERGAVHAQPVRLVPLVGEAVRQRLGARAVGNRYVDQHRRVVAHVVRRRNDHLNRGAVGGRAEAADRVVADADLDAVRQAGTSDFGDHATEDPRFVRRDAGNAQQLRELGADGLVAVHGDRRGRGVDIGDAARVARPLHELIAGVRRGDDLHHRVLVIGACNIVDAAANGRRVNHQVIGRRDYDFFPINERHKRIRARLHRDRDAVTRADLRAVQFPAVERGVRVGGRERRNDRRAVQEDTRRQRGAGGRRQGDGVGALQRVAVDFGDARGNAAGGNDRHQRGGQRGVARIAVVDQFDVHRTNAGKRRSDHVDLTLVVHIGFGNGDTLLGGAVLGDRASNVNRVGRLGLRDAERRGDGQHTGEGGVDFVVFRKQGRAGGEKLKPGIERCKDRKLGQVRLQGAGCRFFGCRRHDKVPAAGAGLVPNARAAREDLGRSRPELRIHALGVETGQRQAHIQPAAFQAVHLVKRGARVRRVHDADLNELGHADQVARRFGETRGRPCLARGGRGHTVHLVKECGEVIHHLNDEDTVGTRVRNHAGRNQVGQTGRPNGDVAAGRHEHVAKLLGAAAVEVRNHDRAEHAVDQHARNPDFAGADTVDRVKRVVRETVVVIVDGRFRFEQEQLEGLFRRAGLQIQKGRLLHLFGCVQQTVDKQRALRVRHTRNKRADVERGDKRRLHGVTEHTAGPGLRIRVPGGIPRLVRDKRHVIGGVRSAQGGLDGNRNLRHLGVVDGRLHNHAVEVLGRTEHNVVHLVRPHDETEQRGHVHTPVRRGVGGVRLLRGPHARDHREHHSHTYETRKYKLFPGPHTSFSFAPLVPERHVQRYRPGGP